VYTFGTVDDYAVYIQISNALPATLPFLARFIETEKMNEYPIAVRHHDNLRRSGLQYFFDHYPEPMAELRNMVDLGLLYRFCDEDNHVAYKLIINAPPWHWWWYHDENDDCPSR
jgi:hypothetical protein